MSSDFNPLLWFVCKICRQAFPDTEKLKKHQIRKHVEQCKNVKCIVFEERLFDKQWIPSDNYFPESNYEFTNENLIEVAPLTSKCGCHCHSISAVSVPAETQTESILQPRKHKPNNPYVLVKRLTFEELNAALSRNDGKLIFQAEKRKRTCKLFVNHDDVQSPNKKKMYFKHQQNQDQEQNICTDVNPEYLPEIVAPNANPTINKFPQHVKFSLFSSVKDPSGNALSDIEYYPNIQNVEDNEFEKRVATATQASDSQNHPMQKVEDSSNNTSTLALQYLSDFGSSSQTQVTQGDGENENRFETNNPEPNPLITDVYYSDSECFETESPVSPELSDYVNILGEQNLPNFNVSENISDRIKSTNIIKNPAGHGSFNVKLNQQEGSVSASDSCSLTTPTRNTYPESVSVKVSEIENSRRSTRASRKHSKINYSETHMCSNCNLDFDTFDDLQDHQRLCAMQYNRMNSVTNKNDADSANRRDKNGGDSVVQIDNTNDSKQDALKSPLNIKSRKISQISTSISSSKVLKNASNATDGGDSDYTVDGDEDVSESKTNDYIKPVTGSLHRMPKRETLKGLSAPTAPQHRMQPTLNEKATNLALFKWLETKKKLRFPDGSKNKIYLCTKRFLMSKVIGPSNHIKCKLCKIKLETESKLKNHVSNCWLHNQSNHVYCIPCRKPCGSPYSLTKHFKNKTYARQHANFRQNNGPHVLDLNADDLNEDHLPVLHNDPDFHPTDPISAVPSLKVLPLLQWLKIQHENPDNVVALEPDPLTSNKIISVAAFTLNESSPIKCKLCLQLLTSDVLLRNHVETCWSQNKAKHRYCVPCNKYYNSVFCLRQHQRCKHKNALYRKQKQESTWSCTVCHKNMQNELDFNAHQESLQIFLGKGSETESKDFQRKSKSDVDSIEGQYIDIAGQEGTMKNLFEWLKHIRKILNSDGTANLILIDPEPTSHSSGALDRNSDEVQINENNPITCRLCLKKLTTFDHVQIHVKVCWSKNKERHCYCVSCEEGFATPIELQEHRTSEHSAPKNIVLFYREADGAESLVNVDGLEVNSDNPVTCKLCETELTSVPEVKIHSDNCWFHNKSRHVFCTICDRRFDTVKKLRCHNTNQHRNKRSCGSVEDKSDSESETEERLPLEAWIKIQKENPNNVIALEPDDFVSETVTECSPVKCSLCQQLLTTESALRNHVRTCWKFNKSKHCYCIPCDQHFAANQYLLVHNKAKHPNKYSTILPTCLKCSIEFLTESELTKHTESLRKFLRQRKHCTKAAAENVNSVNTPGSQIPMAYLFEWLKHLRQIRNLDGTENVILVDPEPQSDNFDEFNSKNPITCRLCQQKFSTVRALQSHVQNCWTQKKEIHRFCVTCEKVFETPRNLQDHSKKEHPEIASVSFTCKLCRQEFFDVKNFEEHEKAHKDLNFLPFKCPHCPFAFNNRKDLSQHITGLHGRFGKVAAFKCKICLKAFTAGNLLNNHVRSVHTGERPFKCKFPDCSLAFTRTGDRQRHYHSKHREELGLGLEPSQQFLCPTCGKTYKIKMKLNRHLKISHTQEKPYKCTHQGCTKDFKIKERLIEHVREHTGEKPYQCEECGKSFAKEWTFAKHKRSHAGTLNRAQCHLCLKKFLGGWELKQHMKIHGEGFRCQICGVEFATQLQLGKHEKTHGNEPNIDSEDQTETCADSDV